MVDYTQPIKTTFEMQRKSLEQGQQALERTFGLQNRVGEAAVDGLETQESVQRNAVELQKEFVHNVLDSVEANVPGTEEMVVELRDMLDDQYDVVLDSHEELFANLTGDVEEGIEAVDEMSDEYFEMLEEQLDALYEAHEELEVQSVEAVDETQEQLGELQSQVEEMQVQMQEATEQAVESVEA